MHQVGGRGRRSWTLVTAASVVAVVAAACTSGSGHLGPTTAAAPAASTTSTTVNVRRPGPLRLGVIIPLTGPSASFGSPLLAGIDLAVKQINDAGGVNGEPVTRLAPRDEGKDPESAAELIRDGAADAIIGPASSPDALAIAEAVNQAGVVTCSPTAGSVALTRFGNKYVVRTVPSDALQGAALAKALSQSGLGSAAVVYPDDDYGQAIFKQLRSHLDAGVVSLLFSSPYDANGGDAELDAVASQLVASDPRMVAVIGLPESGARMLSHLRSTTGASRVNRWYVSDAMREPNLFEKVSPGKPDGLSNVLGVSPLADPLLPGFATALRAVTPDAAIAYAAYAYDCVNLVALAAQLAGSNDPRDFRSQLVDVSRGGAACSGFVACAASAAMKPPLNFDYDGVSGPVDLDANGDVTSARYELFGFDDSGRDVREYDFLAP